MNIITWNMQGASGSGENKWNTDVKRLFIQCGINVACLQECGNPPPGAAPAAAPGWLPGFAPPVGVVGAFLSCNLGTMSRPFNVCILWFETDPAGHRNNLAVVSTLLPVALIYADPGPAGGRPALGMRLLYGVGGYANFFTLHAHSPGGGNAPGLIANINAAGAPWFAAGDYNREPATWAGVILPVGTIYCGHGRQTTHPGSGTNLDYAFKNPGAAVYGTVLNNFVVSDHFPVAYLV